MGYAILKMCVGLSIALGIIVLAPKTTYTYVIRIQEGCFGDEEDTLGWKANPIDLTDVYRVEHKHDTAIIHIDINDRLWRESKEN